jgi:glucosyl-dolichyl phosphate glucuronosyltransferase
MISVIIPTLNRSILLEKTLLSIAAQNLNQKEFEVLIIDNGSTDKTKEVAESCLLKNVRYISEPKPGLHRGRHRGLFESKGDILVYADDDIEALPSWLSAIKESFADPSVAIVGGKDIPNYESPPPPWVEQLWNKNEEGKFMTYYSLIDLGEKTKTIDPVYVFGCNFSIRKEILFLVNGFHPDGMPQSLIKYRGDGETYVAEKVKSLGYKTVYNPKASVKHWVPSSRMNKEYLLKRAFADGITRSYCEIRSGNTEKKLKAWLKSTATTLRSRFQDSLSREISTEFRNGYNFHQNEVRKDQELLKWILKENYLDS